jgi:autotransporter-associated beta strand protein
MSFNNSAKAGTSAITNNAGLNFNDGARGDHATIINQNSGVIGFNGTSTADHANITNTFATTTFTGQSTAADATILNSINGATYFSGDSSAGNANITNTGSLALGAAMTHFLGSSTAGNATITNNAFGGTNFTDQSRAGTATIINNQDGITFFGSPGGADTASADHATIINSAGPGGLGLGTGGFTEFFASTTAGNATIITGNGGAVAFIDSSSGGAARFITNAGAAFDISQLTTAGTTAGSIEGAGTYYLGDKQLTVGSNNLSTTVSGIISDGSCGCFGPGGIGGSLVKVGTGTLTLSGINTYTGATTVNGGALIVDGSTVLSALTTVNAGGTLGGSGTVGNTAITGGTLAPGSAGGSVFGPLTVQGTLSFTAASTYMIQVSPANAGLTNVTGAATLGGATVNAVFAPGSYVDRQYTILNATGGVSGTFNPAVTSNLTNLHSTLTYDANNVFLNIQLIFVPPPGVTLNTNQQNVGNALTNFFNVNGSIPAAFAGLNAAGLTIASGELGTGIIQSAIKADDLFLNLLLDPSVAGRAGGFVPAGSTSRFAEEDEALAYAAKRRATPSERDAYAMARKAPSLLAAQPANRWSVWGAAYGGSATVDGNAAVGSHDVAARVYGVVAGVDYKVTPDTLLGFALAGGGTSYTLSDGLGRGSSDLFQAGAFGRHNFGPGYVSAAVAYGWHDVTTNRTVALAGIDQLQGRFKAETFSGRFEGGYRFVTPMVGITPYAAAQVISFNLPAYAEQALAGGALFALNYASQTTTATRSELGLRSDKSIAMQDAVLTLRGRAAWAHDYNLDRAVTAVFQALPGASFVVNGARGQPDAALVSAGAEMKWLNGFSLMATFEGEFSGNTTSYAGKGVARYTW